MSRPVAVPLYVLLVVAAALGLTVARGLLLARERHAQLQPARAAAEITLTPTTVVPVRVAAGARFLVLRTVGAAGRRVALHQVLPQRRLVRWIEAREGQGEVLVLPLLGLRDGTYSLSLAQPGEQAGPVEMDAAPQPREELGSFELTRE